MAANGQSETVKRIEAAAVSDSVTQKLQIALELASRVAELQPGQTAVAGVCGQWDATICIYVFKILF